MERIDNNSPYELFGSSDISLGRLFWYRRFDNGMVAFLMCLKEMGDFAEQKDRTFKLPHKMEKDKVGDMSIKIQFNNEETWTKSLKYMLTNLKWLLAWVVKMEAEQLTAKHGKPLALRAENENNNNEAVVEPVLEKKDKSSYNEKYSQMFTQALKDYNLNSIEFSRFQDFVMSSQNNNSLHFDINNIPRTLDAVSIAQ